MFQTTNQLKKPDVLKPQPKQLEKGFEVLGKTPFFEGIWRFISGYKMKMCVFIFRW